MTFYTDILDPQRVDHTDLGDALIFHRVPPLGWHVQRGKCLDNYWMKFCLDIHPLLRMNCNNL